MHPAQLRGMNDEQLRRELEESYKELQRLRFQKATGQLEKPSEIRRVRRKIARIKTIIREREILRSYEEAQ